MLVRARGQLMSRNTTWFALLLLTAAGVGCGKKESPVSTPSPTATAQDSGGSGATSDASDTGTPSKGTTETPAATTSSDPPASANLASHGVGLSILQPDSLAVAKLDVKAARNAPRAKQALDAVRKIWD